MHNKNENAGISITNLLESKNQTNLQYNNSFYKGRHLLIDCRDCPEKILTDSKAVLSALINAIEKAGATILTTSRHELGLNSSPGYAIGIILDESHCTAHCYSQEKLLAIDFFTCSTTNPEDVFEHFISDIDIGSNYSKILINRFTDK